MFLCPGAIGLLSHDADDSGDDWDFDHAFYPGPSPSSAFIYQREHHHDADGKLAKLGSLMFVVRPVRPVRPPKRRRCERLDLSRGPEPPVRRRSQRGRPVRAYRREPRLARDSRSLTRRN